MSRLACRACVVACLLGALWPAVGASAAGRRAAGATPFGPLASSPAAGLTCTDSWKTATSGDWFNGTKWSTGAPPTSGDDACITIAGTYTVTMAGNGPSVHSLALGASGGAQTLAVLSTCSAHA